MVSILGAVPFGESGRRRCSFCGRREGSARHLVRARGGAHICERCVAQAHEAVASADPEQKLLRIRPTPEGIPDRDEAELAVERAFELVFNPQAPVPERCAAIEGGANLMTTMQEVQSRYGRDPDLDVVVDNVRFLSHDEAEVHFVLLGSRFGSAGLARTGHAVRVGDDWKVSRDTWCGLVSMVGVTCPPQDG